MKLTHTDRAILTALLDGHKLRSLEIYDRTPPIPYMWIFKRRVKFAEIPTSLAKLQKLGFVDSKSISRVSNNLFSSKTKIYWITEAGKHYV